MSFGYDVSVMILLRILILSKIITLTYLKLTIKTNRPHYIYIYKSENPHPAYFLVPCS